MWAAIAAAGCCCDSTECDCPEYDTVTVTWSGSFTFEWCCDCGCGSGDHTESFGPIAVSCARVEGTGNCLYVGEESFTITIPICGTDPVEYLDWTVHVYATVYYNALASKWEAAIYVQRDWSTVSDYCGWWSGGFGNAMLAITKRASAANGTYPLCPYLGTYSTNVSTCEPSGAECSTGVDCCATLSAYSSGSVSVSYP